MAGRLEINLMKSIVVAAAILALSAGAASANIVIVSGSVPQNPDENVLLNSGTSGTTLSGTTNQTNSLVTFQGLESLTEPSNGQARIEAVDGSYTSLTFFLTDPTKSFGRAEFNLNTLASGMATITATDQFGTVFTQTFAVGGNGQNFFNLVANSGEAIKTVSISSTAQIGDTRQIRLGGVGLTSAVPEPATWSMLILGFGMVGAGMRLRRRTPIATA
jgi:hypothetical protein